MPDNAVSTGLNYLSMTVIEQYALALAQLKKDNIPVALFEGYRSPKRQAQLYAEGRTAPGNIVTHSAPWDSYHQYGLAFDVAIYEDGKWSWEDHAMFMRAVPYFTTAGFRWLGENDMGHYELPTNISLEEMKNMYITEGYVAVWQQADYYLNQTKGTIH